MENHHSGGRFLREPPKPRRSKAPLIIALGLALVLLLGIGGFFLLRGGVGNALLAQPETTEPPTTETPTEPPTTEAPTEAETEPPTTEPLPSTATP